MVIDLEGDAWLFGRNSSSALGLPDVDYVSENAPRLVKPSDLGASSDTKFVHAACGRNHTLLVGSDGSLWSAGANNVGQVRVFNLFMCNGSEHKPICSAVIQFALKYHRLKLSM